MGLLDNLSNKLFNRMSKSSNVNSSSSNSKYSSYISLFQRDDTVGYHTGRKILKDTQVSTGFEILKYLLSSKKWILTNLDDEDDTVYNFVNDMLKNMDKEVNTIVKQMCSAILWGFSVHEIIYEIQDGKIVVKTLIPLHIKTLQNNPFKYDDDTGDLVSIHQRTGTFNVDIPVEKCLLYSYNSLYDEYEGHGLLHDFLPIVEDKEDVMDWLMTFAEKNESPTLYGKTNDPTSRDSLLKVFEDISNGTTGMVVGQEDEVGVLESSHRGETFFSILQYKDNQILRRMFIGNLLLGDNSQTGTYAQSQTQLEFGNIVDDGLLEEFANAFQEQVINPIVEWNFGKTAKAPLISFDKFSRGDMQMLFTIVNSLIASGTLDGENSAVHEALALLFKSEAGVEYVNDEPVMPDENFEFQESVGNDDLTTEILSGLEDVYAE